MSWMIDPSGALGRGQFEAGWWSLLMTLGQASHVALAGAYLVVITKALKLRGKWRDGQTLAGPFRRVSALLCFCALAHAGDAVVSYLARERLFTLPSAFAAVFTLAAASRLARFAGVARGPESPPRPAGLLHLVGPQGRSASEAIGTAAADGLPDAAGEHGEWARLRLATVEDAAQRDAWLLQNREQVERLREQLGASGLPPAEGRGENEPADEAGASQAV